MRKTIYTTLAAGVIFAAVSGTVLHAQEAVSNYVRKTIYTQADTSQWKRQETAWLDGLGRPVQTVRKGASPTGGDLANLTEYDSLGREQRVWQETSFPSGITGPQASAAFKSAAQSAWSDSKPYSETVYDGTPLDRVRKQIGSGNAWHSANKGVGYDYLSGRKTVQPYKVACYKVTFSGNTVTITRNRFGEDGEFRAVRTTDEDGRVLLEFKDMDDRTVQTIQELPGSGGTVQYLTTCYVYDIAGRLTGVFPPMLTATLTGSGSSPSWNSTSKPAILQFGYFYRYDDRGRLIAKKLPGADWTYYIYDKGDRQVFSQDGVQRSDGKWAFSLQDRLGRTCMTGLCADTLDVFSNPLASMAVTAVRDDALGTLYGYHVDGLTLQDPEVLTVQWWDDYGFLGLNGIPSAQSDSISYDFPEIGYGERYAPSAAGLCTGTMSKVLDNASTPSYLWTVTYYDDKGRPVQEKRSTHLGGFDAEAWGYDFLGQMKKRKVVHGTGVNSTLTERYAFEYDDWGRPTTTTHKLGSGTVVTLADCVYDSLGRLERDRRNGTNPLDTRYSYNVRNWLTELRVGFNASTNTLGTNYLQDLYYNVGRTSGSSLQWTGNISGMSWKTNGESVLYAYDFTYDGLSRLTGATSSPSGGQTRSYTYDNHGNIQSVTGGGASQSFSYTGNQLTSDQHGGVTTQHTYDGNGRLSTSGSWSYYYNAIGLPSVRANSGGVTRWVYAADGTKLSRETLISTAPRMDYVSNLVYKDSTLNRILVDGGYIDMTGSTPAYCFCVLDHQGNVRLVTDATGTPLQVNHYDPLGNELDMTASTSPVGSSAVLSGTVALNPYKYSGKEWDDQASLYDFSARMYNPSLARFTTMDPLCEKYYSISPYAYCAGNPVNLVDPSGTDSYLIIWRTDDAQVGHAAFAIDNYKEETYIDENGKEQKRKTPDGTVTYYDLWPSKDVGIDNFWKDVPAMYNEKKVSKKDALETDFLEAEGREPEGVIQFTTSYEIDSAAKMRLSKAAQKNHHYNALHYNCSDYAKIGVNAVSDDSVSGQEIILFWQATTPNSLFQQASSLSNASVIKDPGDNVNKRFLSGIKKGK